MSLKSSIDEISLSVMRMRRGGFTCCGKREMASLMRGSERVNEDELRFAVNEESRKCVSFETSVDVVQNGTRHRNCKLELVHGEDVGGHDGNHVVAPLDVDAE